MELGALNILLCCFVPSAFWLVYWYFRASEVRSEWRFLVAFFLAGLVSGPIALTLFEGLELTPFYAQLAAIEESTEVEKFAYSMFAIGPVEELAKFLAVWICLRVLRQEVNVARDGLTFAVATALGFATIENWKYMVAVDELIWHRALTLPFNHVLFSSFWGIGFKLHARGLEGGTLWLIAGIALSSVYHGLYNFILLSSEVPNITVVPLIFGLWVWLVIAIPRTRTLEGSPRKDERD